MKLWEKNENSRNWNTFIQSVGDDNPMAYQEWQGILQKSYDLKTYFFYNEDEKKNIQAVCPTYLSKFQIYPTLYSLAGGIVAKNLEQAEFLITDIKNFCAKKKIDSLLLSAYEQYCFAGMEQNKKSEVFFQIKKTKEETWNSLRDKSRNLIRKAKKEGFRIEKNKKNLADFYNIYFRFIRSKKNIPHSLRFFKTLLETFQNSAELITASSNNVIVGGILVIFGAKKAIYPFQAATLKAKKASCTQLLIWEAVKSCLNREIESLSMGESSINSPVFKSKINFGGLSKDIYQYKKGSLPAQGLARSTYIRFPAILQRPLTSLAKVAGKVI